MAIADKKKKKKYQGGPKRKSYLKSMASKTSRPMGQYMKYGDIDPRIVHEGIATYRDTDYAPTTNINFYSVAVARGEGKAYFRHGGKLYTHNATSGGSIEEIPV